MQNKFTHVGPQLEAADIKNLENELGVQLPEAMKAFYLESNGGMPDLDHFPGDDVWEPICLHVFLKLGRESDEADEEASTIQSTLAGVKEWMGCYPASYVPFAVDPGANLFCLDTSNGSVHYLALDVYDEDLSDDENLEEADRFLRDSFEGFLSSLISEDDAYA